MTKNKPQISIVNVVSSVKIDQELNLVEITKKIPTVEYHPDQFPGIVFRLNNPRATMLIFRTGNMVCTGATSEDLSIKAVDVVIQKLRKAKIKIKNKPKVKIQNIVSAINLESRVNIEQAARTIPRSMYEPEQFPAMIHRMLDPKTVILIFATGKLICVGARHERDVYRSVNQIHSLLEEKNLMEYD
ncbi:MAG: TATA box-binding protein [Nitrosopumilus sp.]|nr:MAG: TATA box-binding protein [Nitrosopumilus sp.]QMU55432.1 MAG: TATA box-binding protein [Nitrosopumilus sp.]